MVFSMWCILVMYTLSGKPGSVKPGFSVNGAAFILSLTHQRCWSPLSQKMGEGFQSNMNFSFFIREKVAARSDKGPVGTIKTAMSLP